MHAHAHIYAHAALSRAVGRAVAAAQLRPLAAAYLNTIQRADCGAAPALAAAKAVARTAIAFTATRSATLAIATSPARSAAVRAQFGLPVWKVIPVATASDVVRAQAYTDAADFILFDAKTPKDAQLPGGMGLRFDWALLSGISMSLPWGLAGGLSPTNVAGAIAATGAPLVDTSSGVESAPGAKDMDKIAAFCKAARSV